MCSKPSKIQENSSQAWMLINPSTVSEQHQHPFGSPNQDTGDHLQPCPRDRLSCLPPSPADCPFSMPLYLSILSIISLFCLHCEYSLDALVLSGFPLMSFLGWLHQPSVCGCDPSHPFSTQQQKGFLKNAHQTTTLQVSPPILEGPASSALPLCRLLLSYSTLSSGHTLV